MQQDMHEPESLHGDRLLVSTEPAESSHGHEQAVPTEYTIAVVGLGKIGLPLAVQYAMHGFKVVGCDTNAQIVESLNAGKPHIQEEAELALEVPRLVREGLFTATTQTTEAVRQAQVVVVIVPVFINADHQIDFTWIDMASSAIGAGLQPGTLVIYETTLPVGTTSRRLRSQLEAASGLRAGTNFYLAYSPERVSSGSIFRDLRGYPKIVGGIDRYSTALAVKFYRAVLEAEIITMASTDEAEFVKLIETTYRDVNIALANEYARYADAHGLNVYAAISAANTQPYSHIHTPGIGVGGHCIPVYPYFLFANPYDEMSNVRTYDETRPQADGQLNTTSAPLSRIEDPGNLLVLPRQARHINDAMAEYAVQRIEDVVGPLRQKAVLLLGVAYRGDVRETAFSSAQRLREALMRRGAIVYVDDPLYSESELRAIGYEPLPSGYDSKVAAILLQCAHQAYQSFDFARFTQCKIVLDGRHALCRETIEALGMSYIAIGEGNRKPTEQNIAGYTSSMVTQ